MNNEIKLDEKRVYEAVEIGPTQVSSGQNETEYIVATFKEFSPEGVIGHSKPFTKVMFEDSHALAFSAAEQARDNDNPSQLKIRASFTRAACQPHFLEIDGELQKNGEGEPVIIDNVLLFLIADENPKSAYRRALRGRRFVDTSTEVESEAEKAEELAKKSEEKK